MFSNLTISKYWTNVVSNGLKVEVANPQAIQPSDVKNLDDCFWIASVVEVAGFFVCLRWEGYESDNENDFWLNIIDPRIHPVGYSQSNGKHLLPPRLISTRQSDWRKYLYNRMLGSHTLPSNFQKSLSESLTSDFKVGLKIEIIDINRVSSVCPATIIDLKGTRLQIGYDSSKVHDHTNSIWCDQRSNLIHPVGWSQLVGHELKSSKGYATSSLNKVKTGNYDDNDCDFSYFPHLYAQMNEPYLPNEIDKFEVGMKIEAIDALNMRTVNVASVFKVLRYDYLMIGIDGMTSEDGSDAFCYHRSDCLPINYCKKHKIPLTTPEGCEKKRFNYTTYLTETNSRAAPETLFKNDVQHMFKVGMYLEAVDLMEPHLLCPAFVKQVAGRLLKISFCGWPDAYDQWCDYKCPEIYPMGYCDITGYNLEQPKNFLEIPQNDENLCFDDSSDQTETIPPKTSRRSTTNSRQAKIEIPVESNKRKKVSGGKSIEKIREINETQPNSFEIDHEESSGEAILLSSTGSISEKMIQSNPLHWSVREVGEFWKENGFGEYSDSFELNQITGAILVKLSREDVFHMIGNKLGPSLKLYAKINELKQFHQIS